MEWRAEDLAGRVGVGLGLADQQGPQDAGSWEP